jgi:hypothetical protein
LPKRARDGRGNGIRGLMKTKMLLPLLFWLFGYLKGEKLRIYKTTNDRFLKREVIEKHFLLFSVIKGYFNLEKEVRDEKRSS